MAGADVLKLVMNVIEVFVVLAQHILATSEENAFFCIVFHVLTWNDIVGRLHLIIAFYFMPLQITSLTTGKEVHLNQFK